MPNNDPGCDVVFDAIDRLPGDRFRVLPSMRFAYFSELLRHAQCVVGNSSLGVREAPFLGVPSLDIGTRQANRAAAPSISHADAGDAQAIAQFLDREWGRRYPVDRAFGDGDACEKFGRVLRDPEFWQLPLQKQFHDGE